MRDMFTKRNYYAKIIDKEQGKIYGESEHGKECNGHSSGEGFYQADGI